LFREESYSEIAHLAYAIALNDAPRLWMLWLTGYFDAAGHPDGEHALAVGGYISSVPMWLRFEKAWKKVLRKNKIDIFHMADFMACADEFKNWLGRKDEQSELLLKLAGITKEHVRHGFSTMVFLDAWKEVNKTYKLRESHCTPYGLCGFFTVDKAMRWLVDRKRRFALEFVFEDGDKHKGDLMWMIDQFVRTDKRVNAGAAPNFRSKRVVPLQAADFVTWQQYRFVANKLTKADIKPHFYESFAQLVTIPKTWGVIDEEALVKFCVGFEIPKRDDRAVWTGPMRALVQ
jgi:hypothetical protein